MRIKVKTEKKCFVKFLKIVDELMNRKSVKFTHELEYVKMDINFVKIKVS